MLNKEFFYLLMLLAASLSYTRATALRMRHEGEEFGRETSIVESYEGKKFDGKVLRHVIGRSKISCVLMCRQTTGCQYINYKSAKQICELTKGDKEEDLKYENEDHQEIDSTAMAVLNICKKTEEEMHCPLQQRSCSRKRCLDVYPSCVEALYSNNLTSGEYKLSFWSRTTYELGQCVFSHPMVQAIFKHDKPDRQDFQGPEKNGSVTVNLNYDNDLTLIYATIDKALRCWQYVKARCYNQRFLLNETAWLTGRKGRILNYWGGGDPEKGGCKCFLTESCTKNTTKCNCSANIKEVTHDAGDITKEEDLPITGGHFEDLNQKNERLYLKVQVLKCAF